MRGATLAVAAAVLLAAARPAVRAEEVRAALPRATLAEAVRAALARSRDVKMAREDAAAAREGAVKARARLLPRVDAGADFTALSEPPAALIQGRETQTAERNIFRARLSAEQTLYDFGRTAALRSRAGARIEEAGQAEAAARERAAFGAVSAFLAAKRAEELLAVAEESLETAKAHLGVTRDHYELGVVAKNDVLAAEVTVANAEAAVIAARNQVELSRSRLALRMGYPGDAAVAPAEGDFPVPADPVPPLEESVRAALENRGEIRALAAAVREAEAARSGARAEFAPQFFAQGGYSYETNEFNPHKDVLSIVAGGRVNLFAGFSDEASVREAEALLARRREALAKAREEAALEVKEAHLSVAEAQKRLDVARVAVARAEENLRIQNDRYAEGLAINTEVLDAQALLTRARADARNAAYDFYEARYALLFARGELAAFALSWGAGGGGAGPGVGAPQAVRGR